MDLRSFNSENLRESSKPQPLLILAERSIYFSVRDARTTSSTRSFFAYYSWSRYGRIASFGNRKRFVSTVVLILGALVGSAILSKWDVSDGTLALAGGLIFLLVALPMVISAPSPATEHDELPNPRKGLYRQLIATLVTPFGLAALVLFVRLMPSQTGPILAVLVAVMIFDLIAMVFARPLLKYLTIPLQALAMIFSVLQVALALQEIVYGLRFIAINTFGMHDGQ